MTMASAADPIHRILLSDESETARLAADLARVAQPGDIFCLGGDLGSGKSTFARAFIRSRLQHRRWRCESPTFTLVQDLRERRDRHRACRPVSPGQPDEFAELACSTGSTKRSCWSSGPIAPAPGSIRTRASI